MAGHALEQILGYMPLTGVVQATISGIPNTLPPALMTKTRDVIGDAGVYTRVTGERRLSSLARYGSPAKARNLREVGTFAVKLMHTYEKQPIDPMTMQRLRNYDNYDLQRLGKQEVSRQVKEFGKLVGNLRIASVQMTLANGAIHVNSDGDILPTSSGAQWSVDFGMAAAHQGQLNNGTTAIIDEPWNDPASNIPQQLTNLETRAVTETGYVPKLAIYGKNVPSYLIQNDNVVDYLARKPDMSVEWLKNPGRIPQGLMGFTWVPAYHSHFRDQTDTTAYEIWGDDLVVFCPEVSAGGEMEEWWEILEGSFLIPDTLDIISKVESLDRFKQVYGAFSYAQLSTDPAGMVNYQGDTFLPILRNPDVLWQADVVF